MWTLKRTLELEPKLSLNKYIFSHEKIVSQIEHFSLDNIYETEEINYLVTETKTFTSSHLQVNIMWYLFIWKGFN